MDERRRVEFNENYDNKLKAKLARIEKRFDDKDRKLRARRGKAEAELYKRLKDDLEPQESTTEGYAQETIKKADQGSADHSEKYARGSRHSL